MNRNPILRVVLASLLLAAVIPLAVPAQETAEARPQREFEKLQFPPLNEIKPPEVIRETLPNGMKLLLVVDRGLPKVEFEAMIRGGKLAEPREKPGIVELFTDVHRTGGTRSVKGDEVDEILDNIGAVIEASGDDAYMNLYGMALTEHLDTVLPLFAEFLMAPGFEEEKIELGKSQLKSAIGRRNDQPMGILMREFGKLVYGEKSPYARQFEYDDVNGMTREDLLEFHAKCYRPDAVTLAVWGDFDAAAMKARLAGLFGGWENSGPAPDIVQPFVFPPEPSVNYIEKTDAEQTFLLLGHLGLKKDDPDYPAVLMLNDILGGGFASRLFNSVRTKKGLAYAAQGGISAGYDHPGYLYAFSSTKPASTAEAIDTIIEEIEKIRQEPVTDGELSRAKDAYLNSYAFEFDSTQEIVDRLMTYDFFGYPEDFNMKLRDGVEKVTKEMVLAAAKKHLQPENLIILAVGRAEEFDRPLSDFGEVNTLDITIPDPTPTEVIPEATPESKAQAIDILVKAAKAVGEKALLDLKSVSQDVSTSLTTPQGPFTTQGKRLFIYPDKQSDEFSTPMGTVVQVFNGEQAWVFAQGKAHDIPASEYGEYRRSLYTYGGALRTLREALEGTLEAQYLGTKDFEGTQAEDILVTTTGGKLRLYVSVGDSRVLGARSQGKFMQGPAEITEIFEDYREVDGLQIPFKMTQQADGEPVATVEAISLLINGEVSEGSFVKPE